MSYDFCSGGDCSGYLVDAPCLMVPAATTGIFDAAAIQTRLYPTLD
jgi:hypothetical protein